MSQKLKRNNCPQCGAGDEVATWLDTTIMLCCCCGHYADITKIDSNAEFETLSPWYVLKQIRKRNLSEHVYSVPGHGVIGIADCLQLYERGIRRDEVVRKYERLVESGIDMDSSFITKANGDKVEFVRGSHQSVVDYLDLIRPEFPKLQPPSGIQYRRAAVTLVNGRYIGLKPLF